MIDIHRTPIIISLTTISSRSKGASETIRRLLNQKTTKSYEVHLFISQEPYMLDEGFRDIPHEIKELLNKYSHFRVRWTLNSGPYRKLLPALADAWVSGTDSVIITCDDDVNYPDDFLEIITEAHRVNQCITAFRGYTIQVENGRILPYEEWQKAKRERKSLRNIPTGKDGILYRASYFDEGVFHVENIVANAPTTDDLWFKWHTAIKRVPVEFIVHAKEPEFSTSKELNKHETLWRKFNKYGGNDKTVSQLENFFLESKKENIASAFTKDSREIDSCVIHASAPSVLKVANNALRNGDLIYSEFLYKLIIERNPHDKEALFNLAYLLMRKKDQRVIFSFYQLAQKLTLYKNNLLKLADGCDFCFNDEVLVIIPAFNSKSTIRQSVESVVNQSYKNIFIVIVNDCSCDETLSICFNLERQHRNVATLSLYDNSGPFIACNHALDLMSLSDFKYYIKHDADDLMQPDKIRKQIEALNSGDYFFCTAGYTRISFPDKSVVSGKNRGHNMTLYRRQVFEKIGFFDDTRFGGDSEYLERATLCFGEDAETHIKERLTLAYTMPGSLVDKNPLGSEVRRLYIESYKSDHQNRLVSNNWYKDFPGKIILNSILNNKNVSVFQASRRKDILLNNDLSKKTICVAFPTFNRQRLMERLIGQLDRAASNYNLVILVFDDGSTSPATIEWSKYKNIKEGVLTRYGNHGKKRYWNLVNKIFASMKNIGADYFYYLGDDLEINEDFFEKTINLWDSIDDTAKVSLNLLNDGREECWTRYRRVRKCFSGLDVYLSQWLDMVMLVSPVVLTYQIDEIPLSRWEKNPLISSGVGSQLSTRLLSDGFSMYQACESFVFHGTHESEMNPEERRLRPLVAVT